MAARDVERSLSSMPLLAAPIEYPERMNSLTGPLEVSKAEFVHDPVVAPVEVSTIPDIGLGEASVVDTIPPVGETVALDKPAVSEALPLDMEVRSLQPLPETSLLDTSKNISSQLSSQVSELVNRTHGDGTEDLAGEASIEPVDVSVLIGEHSVNRPPVTEISIANEMSTIQADQIEEATILDVNEPDDLFVTDRRAEYSYSSDEFLETKHSFVCYYRRVIWDCRSGSEYSNNLFTWRGIIWGERI